MTRLGNLDRRLAAIERDVLLRARLDVIEAKLDGLIEDVASFRAVQIEQSQALATHGQMLQILIDRG